MSLERLAYWYNIQLAETSSLMLIDYLLCARHLLSITDKLKNSLEIGGIIIIAIIITIL